MSSNHILYPESISIRTLPANIVQCDIGLFEHELKKEIPATELLKFENVVVNSEGIIFQGSRVLPESFPIPAFAAAWAAPNIRLRFLIKGFFLRHRKAKKKDAFWITDTWSKGYFHWLTDALPRLFTIREKIKNETLLLPGTYEDAEYIESTLKAFAIQNVQYIHDALHCNNLVMPTHTARSGNFNEDLIRRVRSHYRNFFRLNESVRRQDERVYISRGKAQKRKITNEDECMSVMEEYGFKTIYFEDYSFEQQVKIVLNTRFLIANHGSGLANMLFMKPGSCVLELRKCEDAHNNCYFSMASALGLKYFYQLCNSEDPDEDAHTANLNVDCKQLRTTIEKMLGMTAN